MAPQFDAVIIVGEDIDLLVLLTGTLPGVETLGGLIQLYASSSFTFNSKS